MKINKDKQIRVNICYELKDDKKCLTLSKDEAVALRKMVDKEGGTVFWYQAVE